MSKPFLTPDQIRTVLGDTCGPAVGGIGKPVEISQTRGVPGWTQEPWEDKEAVVSRVARTDSALREELQKTRTKRGPGPMVEEMRLTKRLSHVDAAVLLRQWLWYHAEYLFEEDRQRIRAVILGMEESFDVDFKQPVRNGGELPG